MDPRPRRRIGWFVAACLRFALTGAFSTARAWAPTLGVSALLWLPSLAGLRLVWAPGPEAGVLLWIASVALALAGSLIVRFIVAPYFVWREESAAREAAENTIRILTERAAVTSPLREFYREGKRLAARGHDEENPTVGLTIDFKLASRDWQAKVERWLNLHMAPGAAERFSNWNEHHPARYSQFSNVRKLPAPDWERHEWEVNVVYYLLRNLTVLIETTHWDKPPAA